MRGWVWGPSGSNFRQPVHLAATKAQPSPDDGTQQRHSGATQQLSTFYVLFGSHNPTESVAPSFAGAGPTTRGGSALGSVVRRASLPGWVRSTATHTHHTAQVYGPPKLAVGSPNVGAAPCLPCLVSSGHLATPYPPPLLSGDQQQKTAKAVYVTYVT